jgi:hypothetical protein
VISAVVFKTQPATMRRLERGLETAPERMQKSFRDAFNRWGEDWFGRMADRFRGGADGLHTRTGALKRSLNHVVQGGSLADLKLRLTSGGVAYARLQEYGGIVRPKNARFLCIPTEANKTAAGVARFGSPRAFIAAHPGETFFLRKNGKLLLMWKGPSPAVRKSAGAGKGEAVALWYLVRQVEIPGPKAPTKGGPSHLGFFDTWKQLEGARRAGLQQIARAVRTLP